MDKRHQFIIKAHIGSLQQIKSKPINGMYYSELSSEDSPDLLTKTQQLIKLAPKKEFQSDDSDSGTPVNLNRQGQSKRQQQIRIAQKHSKFRDFNHKKNDLKEKSTENSEEGKVCFLGETSTPSVRKKAPKEFIISSRFSPSGVHAMTDAESKKIQILAVKKDKLSSNPFRHLVFAPTIDEKHFFKHLLVTQRGLIYSMHCLKGPSDKFIEQKQVSLPNADSNEFITNQLDDLQKILLLDLDETLVHSCGPKEVAQVQITAYCESGESAKIRINVRPFVDYFLTTVSKYYNIYLFTASSPAYANAIVDYLDPKSSYILGILTRGNCMETKNGFFVKDLRVLKDKKMKDIIMVDNLAHSFGFQLDNGVPILEWHHDPKDQELKYLLNYLIEASKQDDVRPFNRQRLKLRELSEYTIESL